MDWKDLALAIIPPLLAIIIERLNPYDTAFFERQAENIVKAEIGDPADASLPVEAKQAISNAIRILAGSTEGAASQVGVAPTFVSFLASGIALVMILHAPAWWLVALCLVVLVAALTIWRLLSSRNLLAVRTLTVRLPLFGDKPVSKICSWAIYFTNAALVAIAMIIFVAGAVSTTATPAGGASPGVVADGPTEPR
ncbi:hypothetical protein Q9Q95_03300 [Sphingomonas sp. DG1-23]|uniref:hypothetical protein n=1 Tax=Sphingomonas sp. DG1-23 TaxID=3068316 RepID=UPI00273F349F|nr:hypothetical protein [Sphingomonas sp. DG1-23]MDP5277938.1 hypothetical protein [Sphingomonas sp. DG1-23]